MTNDVGGITGLVERDRLSLRIEYEEFGSKTLSIFVYSTLEFNGNALEKF
jgi:hypothetical protein